MYPEEKYFLLELRELKSSPWLINFRGKVRFEELLAEYLNPKNRPSEAFKYLIEQQKDDILKIL